VRQLISEQCSLFDLIELNSWKSGLAPGLSATLKFRKQIEHTNILFHVVGGVSAKSLIIKRDLRIAMGEEMRLLLLQRGTADGGSAAGAPSQLWFLNPSGDQPFAGMTGHKYLCDIEIQSGRKTQRRRIYFEIPEINSSEKIFALDLSINLANPDNIRNIAGSYYA
jgi:hypothetical protein